MRRALNTLRYIHANPKAAGMQPGFFYDFSNYGMHDRLTDDGLTQWHPAFLQLGKTLEECAAKYRKFCQNYRPQPKPERRSYWGNKLLAGMKSPRKGAKGQMRLPWDDWNASNPEISEIAERFIRANALNPEIALEKMTRCQVSEPEKADETVETDEELND